MLPRRPDALRRHPVDLDEGFDVEAARTLVAGLDLGSAEAAVPDILAALYRVSGTVDAELIEINPLALLADGRVVALDCKLTLDDAAAFRQGELAGAAAAEPMTDLERERARERAQVHPARRQCRRAGQRRRPHHDHHGCDQPLRRPAGELPGDRRRGLHQIGSRAAPRALESRREEPRRQFLRRLRPHGRDGRGRRDRLGSGSNPTVPVFFSIHGTGEDEAVRLVRDGLGLEPFDLMEDAVQAAVEAAR